MGPYERCSKWFVIENYLLRDMHTHHVKKVDVGSCSKNNEFKANIMRGARKPLAWIQRLAQAQGDCAADAPRDRGIDGRVCGQARLACGHDLLTKEPEGIRGEAVRARVGPSVACLFQLVDCGHGATSSRSTAC